MNSNRGIDIDGIEASLEMAVIERLDNGSMWATLRLYTTLARMAQFEPESAAPVADESADARQRLDYALHEDVTCINCRKVRHERLILAALEASGSPHRSTSFDCSRYHKAGQGR